MKFVTDPGVSLCGRLVLDLDVSSRSNSSTPSNQSRSNAVTNEITSSNTSSTVAASNNERSSPTGENYTNSKSNELQSVDDEATREIVTKMIFGDTEIKLVAIDGQSNTQMVKAEIDFLTR